MGSSNEIFYRLSLMGKTDRRLESWQELKCTASSRKALTGWSPSFCHKQPVTVVFWNLSVGARA
jgi:hypothetical protein